MGRETKILLGLLATLGGVLLGVLSVKLLVPRPPAGTGPDVTIDLPAVSLTELVEPPSFTPAASGRTAVEQVSFSADATDGGEAGIHGGTATGSPVTPDEGPGRMPPHDAWEARSLVAASIDPAARERVALPTAAPQRDPFVAPATFRQTVDVVPPPAPTAADSEANAGLDPPAFPRAVEPFDTARPSAASSEASQATIYVARPGDSWWHLAERAYGDGRLYRALFAWNRSLDSRVSLTPGTRLEVPPLSRLEAAWPRLVPTP